MGVVSNTTPLNYLVLIDQIELLPQLFDQIVAPHAVMEELRHPRSPLLFALGLPNPHPGLRFVRQ